MNALNSLGCSKNRNRAKWTTHVNGTALTKMEASTYIDKTTPLAICEEDHGLSMFYLPTHTTEMGTAQIDIAA